VKLTKIVIASYLPLPVNIKTLVI